MGEFPAQKRSPGWQIALPPANRVYNIQQKPLVSPFSFQEPWWFLFASLEKHLPKAPQRISWQEDMDSVYQFRQDNGDSPCTKKTGVKRCQRFNLTFSPGTVPQFYEHNIRLESGPLSLLVPLLNLS